MPDEKDSLRVDPTGIIQDPTEDTNDIINFLLGESEDRSRVESDRKTIISAIKGNVLPEPDPVINGPLTPVVTCNEPNKVLSVSLRKNGTLAKFMGNPVENDPLVDAVRNETSTANILNVLMEEMAEEAAFIKAWRNENWDGQVDMSEATSKRIKMLKDLVDTLVEKEKLKKEKNVGKIDFHGDNFQRVLKYFLEVIQRTFKKVAVPSQFEDIFFTQLAKEFDGFEKAAEKIYYGKD
jgi:hypothetical protein